MKSKTLLALLIGSALTVPAFAQDSAPPPANRPADAADRDEIIVTGSSIKRAVNDSAVPLQVFSTADLARESISNPEQFIALLASNGNGADNLAANADITSGAQRGTNGLSSPNLRNQGPGATLVLLNNRRVASHGLGGGSVDVNQIPFAAIERIEVLQDGASAIYGTDAIGGVINFILKKDYQGLGAQGFVDVTEAGGGNIYRGSLIAGYGDLDDDGFNIMVAGSYTQNKILRGTQRDFVNTNQPDRGLSADTRGTPFATIFPVGTTTLNPTPTLITPGNAPFVPGSTTVRATGGINPLDIPGGAGCSSIAEQYAYDDVLWQAPASAYACSYETGKPAVLQQPIDILSLYGRAIGRIGSHEVSLEYMRTESDSAKSFSEVQISNNGTSQQLRFPRTAANAAVYDGIVSQLRTAFPGIVLNNNAPIAYRWRCLECGPRTIETSTTADRIFLAFQGPLFAGWDYTAGASRAKSSSQSQLGQGYYFRGTLQSGAVDPLAPNGLIPALNSGRINIFLRPGETQSADGLAAIAAASAEGTVLYGGEFTITQLDATATGSLFDLPGGTAKAAIGVDYRREQYRFNGDARAATARPVILAAPFDDAFALDRRSRTVKAAFVELLLPVFKGFELNAAGRVDEYTGFGSTVNPKISFRYEPVRWIAFRGSYNTGFRVPSFNQIFNGTLISPLPGADLADPQTCPGGRPQPNVTGCAVINPDVLTGGNLNVGPEESEQFSFGVVFEPSRHFSATIDWWNIDRTGTISTLSVRELVDNFSIFGDRFIRNAAGAIVAIDQRVINAGASFTQGVDVQLRGGFELGNGQIGLGLNGTYLIKKKSQLTPAAPISASEVGVFTFSGDLGLRWKHNAFVSFSNEDFAVSLSQIFRLGYRNNRIGGIAAGTVTRPNTVDRVSDYVIYNASVSYMGLKPFTIIAGVRNLFDRDPPFAITYDTDTGAGSSWEPRVADPRGRAFTLSVEVKL